jgi:hypothetical protein
MNKDFHNLKSYECSTTTQTSENPIEEDDSRGGEHMYFQLIATFGK